MIMKIILTMILCLLATWGQAEDTSTWRQHFDNALPGAQPDHSSMSWGKLDDSLIYISNEKAISQPNSFLIDRTAGKSYNMWGYELRVPQLNAPWLSISTCFQIIGPSFDTRVALEFFGRDAIGKPARALILELGYQRNMPPRSVILRNGTRNSFTVLGHYDDAHWYRFKVWFPASKTSGNIAYGRLEKYQPALKTWAHSSWLQIRTNGIQNIKEIKVICHRQNYKVFFDNMTIQGKKTLPKTIKKSGK